MDCIRNRLRTEKAGPWQGLLRVLLLASVFHLVLAFSIQLAGRLSLFPDYIDGNGIITRSDSVIYRAETIFLVKELKEQGIGAWLRAPYQLHVKLYSLAYAGLYPLFGFSTLSAEPLNLFFYLSAIALVFMLGREIFEARAALLAASLVALWPSFLLLTTQLLRDPLFIVALLALVLIQVRWLTKVHSVGKGALAGLLTGASYAVIWLTRGRMSSIIIVAVLMCMVLFMVRQIMERRVLFGNLLGLMVTLVAIASVPTVIGSFLQPDMFLPTTAIVNGEALRKSPDVPAVAQPAGPDSASQGEADLFWWTRLARVIKQKRETFAIYARQGVNIDAEVELNGASDVLGYLPRAVCIGLFAPFPDMWFSQGRMSGRLGRLITGLETLCIYFIALLAIYSIWQNRRLLSVWFLVFVVIISAAALGLVVVNVGSLYRMRYAFWMLLVVLGTGEARQLVSAIVSKRRRTLEESTSLT